MIEEFNQNPEITKLQEAERQAMLGEWMAIVMAISGLRKYREAVKKALDSRYGDGTIDGFSSLELETVVEQIEGECFD